MRYGAGKDTQSATRTEDATRLGAATASTLKTWIARTPVVGTPAVRFSRWVRGIAYPGSAAFWEKGYSRGGTSGPGSHGRLAEFKAEVVNGFVAEHSVNSVIEFGSGDGNQLAMMNYPSYIGLDVSKSAIKLCKHRFASDGSKSFFLYDSSCFVDNHSMFVADVALSLDVIFHLTEDDVYESYMRHLFSSSRRFVVVYSSDQDTSPDRIACVRHRKFTSWVAAKMPEWVLFEKRVNPMKYPEQRDGSFSDFFFYRRSDSQ